MADTARVDLVRGLLRRVSSENGVGLIELVVAAALGLMVLGCAMAFYFLSLDSQDAAGKRSEASKDLRVAINRMDGEVRQAVAATVISSQVIDLQTLVQPSTGAAKVLTHVRYDCSVAAAGGTYSCTRATGTAYGSTLGTAATLLSSVSNTDVFAVGPGSTATNPSFLNIKLNVSFKSRGNGDAKQDSQLQDGVTLRNISVL